MKRIFDIIISLIGILLFLPIGLLIAVWIKKDSPGPVFYHGPRMGKDGKVFRILKYRTMYENARSYQGLQITSESDPRITPAGKFLRDYKLNEIPQLWNVFRGDMSIIGPRPEIPKLTAKWPSSLRKEILSVRPGITSPASVLFRNEEALLGNNNVMETYINEIQPNKMRLDQLYVRNRSFLLDLDVLFWTLFVLVPRFRFRTPPERSLFQGPISKLGSNLLLWFIIDFLSALLAFAIAAFFGVSFDILYINNPEQIVVVLVFVALFSVFGALIGNHRIDWNQATSGDLALLFIPSMFALGITLVVNSYMEIFTQRHIFLSVILSFIAIVFTRYRERMFASFAIRVLRIRDVTKKLRERILIIGCGDAGRFAAWMLQNSRESDKFVVLGYIDDDMFKQNVQYHGVKVLGGRNDIPDLVQQHDVGIIIFAIHKISKEEQNAILEICKSTNSRVICFPNIIEIINDSVKRTEECDITPETSNKFDKYIDSIQLDVSEKEIAQLLNDLENEIIIGNQDMSILLLNDLRKKLLKSVNQID